MATIATIRDWVLTVGLNRSDISNAAEECAIDFYRVLTSKIPFEELQDTHSFSTVAGTNTYDLATQNIAGIMSIRINYSVGQGIRLTRKNKRWFDNQAPVSGKPHSYLRWKQGIILYPNPSAAFTTDVTFWKRAVIDATPANTTLVIPDAWLELMKWETLHRVLLILKMHTEANALVMGNFQPNVPTGKKKLMHDMGIIPRLWNELLSTISEREHIDEEISINPVVRRYTNA